MCWLPMCSMRNRRLPRPVALRLTEVQSDDRELCDQLVGAWELVSYVEKPLNGSPPNYPMGERPMGIIMYTPDGYMSAQLMRPNPGHLCLS